MTPETAKPQKRPSVKRMIAKAVSLIGGALLTLALLLLVFFAWKTSRGEVPTVFGYSLLHIVSGSMEPAIPVDTYILTKETAPGDLKVGDVIAFYSADKSIEHMPNTHRIIEILERDGQLEFVTQGDANDVSDDTTVTPDRLIGKMVSEKSALSVVGSWMRKPWVFIGIIVVPLTAIIIWELVDIARLRHGAEDEADEGEPDEDDASKE